MEWKCAIIFIGPIEKCCWEIKEVMDWWNGEGSEGGREAGEK